MKARGVDSLYSWVVASSCGIVYLMAVWPMRMGALFFVEMIHRYDTDRKSASLPFALAYCMRSVSSPFAGFFGDKFGLQQVTMLGCVLCSVGVGLCFFSEEIIGIDVCLGLIYGCGLGWSSCLVPEIINQHFAKHRAKGNGLVLGLSGVLNFLTPLIWETVLKNYGISATFLIMSAAMLNSLPAAMLLVKPKQKSTMYFFSDSEIKSSSRNKTKESFVPSLYYMEKLNLNTEISYVREKVLESSLLDKSNSYFDTNTNISSKEPDPLLNKTALNKIKSLEQSEPKNNKEFVMDQNEMFTKNNRTKEVVNLDFNKFNNSHTSTEEVTRNLFDHKFNKLEKDLRLNLNENKSATAAEVISMGLAENKADNWEENLHLDINESIHPCEMSKAENEVNSIEISNKNLTKKTKSNLIEDRDSQKTSPKHKSLNILWSPMFLLITFIQSSHFYVMYISWTITVDLVRDKDIEQYLEVYFVMALALLETIGRFALGFVTDSGYMTVGNCSALCFGVMGLSCLLLVWVSGFALTMIAICIFGFICGANTTGLPGIVTEFIDKEKRTMAMASRLLLCAPMSFTMPPLIGYFRGVLGTYNGLLYVMAAMCLTCSIVLLCLSRVKKHNTKHEK